MIFAKVDVGLPHHHRVLRLPKSVRAEAMGVWLFALCYSREAELDGFCPLEAIDQVAREKVVDELVRVGLLTREEQDGMHGVRILRYAEHNETKSEIVSRKAGDRARKRKADGPTSQPGIQTDSVRNPSPVPSGIRSESERSPVGFPPQGIPDSDSLSVSVSDFRERDSDGSTDPSESATLLVADGPPSAADATGTRLRPVVAAVGQPAPKNDSGGILGPERYITPTDEPTEEHMAIAEMANVQDVAGAWLKFCGYYAGKWVHVTGTWQRWCVNEAKRERTERERAAQRAKDSANPLTPEGLDPSSYEAGQARKKRAKEKQAAEDAERIAFLTGTKAVGQ